MRTLLIQIVPCLQLEKREMCLLVIFGYLTPWIKFLLDRSHQKSQLLHKLHILHILVLFFAILNSGMTPGYQNFYFLTFFQFVIYYCYMWKVWRQLNNIQTDTFNAKYEAILISFSDIFTYPLVYCQFFLY